MSLIRGERLAGVDKREGALKGRWREDGGRGELRRQRNSRGNLSFPSFLRRAVSALNMHARLDCVLREMEILLLRVQPNVSCNFELPLQDGATLKRLVNVIIPARNNETPLFRVIIRFDRDRGRGGVNRF